MVTVWPAMVKVPVRAEVALLAVYENVTMPLPVPLAGVTLSHEPLARAAVHLEDAGTVTIRVPDPLPDGTVSDVAATAGGAATMENGEPVAPVTPAEETLGVYAPVALIARLLKVATPFTADVVGASDPGVRSQSKVRCLPTA